MDDYPGYYPAGVHYDARIDNQPNNAVISSVNLYLPKWPFIRLRLEGR